MLGFRPESIAHTWLDSACSTSALSCTCFGYALSVQAGHTAARVQARNPLKSCIDNDTHTVDGDTRLSNVRCQYYLPLSWWGGINRSPLLIQVELAVKRAKKYVRLK